MTCFYSYLRVLSLFGALLLSGCAYPEVKKIGTPADKKRKHETVLPEIFLEDRIDRDFLSEAAQYLYFLELYKRNKQWSEAKLVKLEARSFEAETSRNLLFADAKQILPFKLKDSITLKRDQEVKAFKQGKGFLFMGVDTRFLFVPEAQKEAVEGWVKSYYPKHKEAKKKSPKLFSYAHTLYPGELGSSAA